jgi:hypothetical protein
MLWGRGGEMKKLIMLILFLSLIICTSLLAAKSSEKEASMQGFIEYCKTAMCRKNLTIKLKQADGKYYERSFELLPPAVQNSTICVYSGETIFIEADVDGDHPVNFKQVIENKNPEKTIVFHLEQSTDIGDGTGMMLTVNNPFPRPLHYKMGMMPLAKENLYKTSSCPVIAGGAVYEQWPHPIFQIVVGGLFFLKEGDSLECKIN